MIKKITKIIPALLLLSLTKLIAQPVLQAANIPGIGDVWPNKTITDTTIQAGPPGPGQVWSFSNYFPNPTLVTEEYVALTGTVDDLLFPTANLKVNSFVNPGGFDYYLKSGSDLQFLGSKSNSNEIEITNAQQLLTVPLAYGNSITNPAVTGTAAGGYPLTGTISVSADAEGSLSLYTSSFASTLRVKTDMNLVVGAGSGLDTYVRIIKYTWYASGYRAPVFQISTADISGALANSHLKLVTISTLTTGINDLMSNSSAFTITPNPAHDKAILNLNSKINTEVSIKIMDITGRVWKNENHQIISGLNNLPVNVSELPKGIYIASLTEGNESRQQRFIVE